MLNRKLEGILSVRAGGIWWKPNRKDCVECRWKIQTGGNISAFIFSLFIHGEGGKKRKRPFLLVIHNQQITAELFLSLSLLFFLFEHWLTNCCFCGGNKLNQCFHVKWSTKTRSVGTQKVITRVHLYSVTILLLSSCCESKLTNSQIYAFQSSPWVPFFIWLWLFGEGQIKLHAGENAVCPAADLLSLTMWLLGLTPAQPVTQIWTNSTQQKDSGFYLPPSQLLH